MKKLALSLTLVAFAMVPALQAGDAKAAKDSKDCKDAKATPSACSACCSKETTLKKGFNPAESKGAMQLVKR
jgi:hypothetical protein